MARPRTITDDRLLAALAQVINDKGPGFTIADVAARAGVSVGTVAQRFGSKHGLLKALSQAAITRAVDVVRAAAPGGPRAALVAFFGDLDDPAAASRNIGQFAVDLADPELRTLLAELFATLVAELTPLLHDLPGAPPHAARLLVSLANGTAVDWSIRPRGSLVDRLTTDIDTVLDGWRKDA
ncbi:TetR/AcrR family transcriptional regulator [Actinocrispum wychmicini]|uniref:TetR family transcriptional regulator n=1 Tax=Actinocrispum wychmicini TaxID=1213861 RepID=A0A4R2JW84_9PSEU|nr:TetR/AcrR family transcriptional regulator [Actinocrispum wychmicini]TCO64751.1 TetR family transcriptional regulator [Actinocrispum wychmicini]